MKLTTINGKTILFVEVPKEAKDLEIDDDGLHLYELYPNSDMTLGVIELEGADWKLLCLSTEMTDEKAKEIMPLEEGAHYFDYVLFRGLQNYVDTALESFQSLVQYLGLDENKTYAILIKEL